MRILLSVVSLFVAGICFSWAFLLFFVTISGGVEQEVMNEDPNMLYRYFFDYMIAFKLTETSIWFWASILGVFLGIVLMPKGRNG